MLNLTKGETSTVISDGNWVFLKLLTIGKHTITFEGGFSNGSKEHDDVTNRSMSFGLLIGGIMKLTMTYWYFLLIHIYMIRVSLTKAENQKAQISVPGNFRTKFNTGV